MKHAHIGFLRPGSVITTGKGKNKTVVMITDVLIDPTDGDVLIYYYHMPSERNGGIHASTLKEWFTESIWELVTEKKS